MNVLQGEATETGSMFAGRGVEITKKQVKSEAKQTKKRIKEGVKEEKVSVRCKVKETFEIQMLNLGRFQ